MTPAAGLLALSLASTPQSPPVLSESDLETGRRLYAESCARCHGPDGRGLTRKAQLLATKPADLTAPALRSAPDADLVRSVRHGPPGSTEHSFVDELDEDEVFRVVGYVRKLQRAAAGKRRVVVPFRAVVGAEPFACGRPATFLGRSRSTARFGDLRFYVSGVRLLDEAGGEHELALAQDRRWQFQDTALLDFETGEGPCANGTRDTRTVVEGLAPDRPFKGLRFVLGVPLDKNHKDAGTAPAPLNLSHLFWSWAAGYKFLRLDAQVEGHAGFLVHLGSTGCTEVVAAAPPSPAHVAHLGPEPMTCAAPNRPEVTLPGFDPDRDLVLVDLAALLAGSDLTRGDAAGGPGCMSAPDDPDCAPVFRNLGLPFAGAPAGPQSVFRVYKGDAALARGFRWRLPLGFPPPRVPYDNPMSDEKVALGRHLFYERRLSRDGTLACATCHDPARAFTDGRARAVGVTGEVHPRGSMSLANVAYSPVLTWANPLLKRLEQQALVPMFGERPVEMGLAGREKALLATLRADARYGSLFREAFPGEDDPFTLGNLTRALASFQRTLISGTSPYDRFKNGRQPDAISDAAKRGEALFFSDRLECFHCHGGFTFSQTVDHEGKPAPEVEFHNTALYNLDGQGSYPAGGQGLLEVTGRAADMGRFKPPTLRNVAVTAPYMHDGSIATLAEVLDHYAAGGRTIAVGPHAGIGRSSPLKSPPLKGFTLSGSEKADLLAFLESLTDQAFLDDPRHQDPWPGRASSPARPGRGSVGRAQD
jgi:cytochrome c peroxidase